MPIYPMKCKWCGAEVDIHRSIAERNAPYPCTCGAGMMRDYARQNVTSTPFFEGAIVFKNGKKIAIETKRAVQEHCKENNLIAGGDDMEQQSAMNRKNNDKEHAEKVSEKVMDDFKRLQVMKREGKVKSRLGNKR